MSGQALAINIKNLSKTYGIGENKVNALKNINLEVKQGEKLAILGPSGAGKTTLLNILGGIASPDQTTEYLRIFDTDIKNYNNTQLCEYRKKRIGFIFQFYNLFPNLTAIENIIIAIEPLNDGLTKKMNLFEIAQKYLTSVQLARRLHHYSATLSGGEQQRVAIARALAKVDFIQNNLILLCDEPTGNLDTKTGNLIIDLIINLNDKFGITCILVTHNESLAQQFTNRIIRIIDGQIGK